MGSISPIIMTSHPSKRDFWLRFVAALLPACVLAVELDAQTFRAGRIELDTLGAWDGVTGGFVGSIVPQPVVIAAANATPQPIRLYTGVSGSLLSMEIGSLGEISIPGRAGIGSGTAATPTERMRVGSITGNVLVGVTIDMRFADSTTGISIRDVGYSGSVGAGLSISSVTSGAGTGIRLGGPSGSNRPTLATGVDVTGGTGVRYNSLHAGGGVGIDVGSTMPPNRGIVATASGADHIGGLFKANMFGTGAVGISRSGGVNDPDHYPRTGVVGFAGTNSNVAADIITGVRGEVFRGGIGGTNTTSIGMDAKAVSSGSSHGGLAIGIRSSAGTSGVGKFASIAALFTADTADGNLALGIRSGNSYLGSATFDLPVGQIGFSEGLATESLSTTWMYDARISGGLSLRTRANAHATILGPLDGHWKYRWPSGLPDVGFSMGVVGRSNDTFQLGWIPVAASAYLQFQQGDQVLNNLGNRNVIMASSSGAGSRLGGIAVPDHPTIVYIINIANELTIVHEELGAAPEQRIRSPFGNNIIITDEGSITLWYDTIGNRWRVISYIP